MLCFSPKGLILIEQTSRTTYTWLDFSAEVTRLNRSYGVSRFAKYASAAVNDTALIW